MWVKLSIARSDRMPITTAKIYHLIGVCIAGAFSPVSYVSKRTGRYITKGRK
jgi:hypothetical protein